VNKDANRFGQLGFKEFEITDPAAEIIGTEPKNLKVELLPKSTADPVNQSASTIRVTPSTDVATDLSNIDDSSTHWCTQLYEIPVLRGVEVGQIAAGSRSSFVRTPNGRVLGWGANEHGLVGIKFRLLFRIAETF
jgi:alpha-tubulin suppressor-like RCC1 family protein